MTFYELLCKYSINELWYILYMRSDFAWKEIRAERSFRSYKSAYEELKSLHGMGNIKDYLLICDMVTDTDDGGAPDSSIGCDMLAPDDSDPNTKTIYSLSFVPWKDLVDAPISDESLTKYGELICAAELLWEVTWWGYSAKQIDDESQRLSDIANDSDNFVEYNPDDFDDFKHTRDDEEESAISEWIRKAPETVKKSVFDSISSDVTARDEGDITLSETLERLKEIIDESTVDIKTECIRDVLLAMLRKLDVDEQYLLLKTVFGGK